jgi:hypothetical protein
MNFARMLADIKAPEGSQCVCEETINHGVSLSRGEQQS